MNLACFINKIGMFMDQYLMSFQEDLVKKCRTRTIQIPKSTFYGWASSGNLDASSGRCRRIAPLAFWIQENRQFIYVATIIGATKLKQKLMWWITIFCGNMMHQPDLLKAMACLPHGDFRKSTINFTLEAVGKNFCETDFKLSCLEEKLLQVQV